MADRDALIEGFLARAGWHDARRAPLAGDASFRRYERIHHGDRRAVLMDAPPEHEDVRPFVAVARYLSSLGLSAPEILAADEDSGLLLLEDLGDDLYTRVLRDGADEDALYAVAVDVLTVVHDRPSALAVPAYDDARLLAAAELFLDWFVPAMSGRPPPADVRAAYNAAWSEVLPLARATPQRLILRDYHADNLLWLPARAGARRCGLLDFQDATLGSVAYDLVSLLEDARRDVAPVIVARALDRYHALVGGDRAAFEAAYAVLGAQRNTRIVGVFTRLWRRDGKARYLDLLPRVWRHLEGDLRHPAMEPVRRWFDANVPPAWRRRP